MQRWNEGWACLLTTLRLLKEEDLITIIYIRSQGDTVTEAINRQLANYPYHVGQLICIAKMVTGQWTSLSIARGWSAKYNADRFSKSKQIKHFTDDELK
jgi:hypothetical protein